MQSQTSRYIPQAITDDYDVVAPMGRVDRWETHLIERRADGEPFVLRIDREAPSNPRQRRCIEESYVRIRRIRHPALARVERLGLLHGQGHFQIARFAPGTNLRNLARHLDYAAVVDILAKLLPAMHLLHLCGVVHSRISPEKIIVEGLDENRVVRLVDIGCSANEDGRRWCPETYRAPELFQQGRPDCRTDLYGLAVTMFEVIAKRPPFTHRSRGALWALGEGQEVPPLRVTHGDCPYALDDLIMRMGSREREERPRNALVAAHALRQTGLLRGGKPSVVPQILIENTRWRTTEIRAAAILKEFAEGPLPTEVNADPGLERLAEEIRIRAELRQPGKIIHLCPTEGSTEFPREPRSFTECPTIRLNLRKPPKKKRPWRHFRNAAHGTAIKKIEDIRQDGLTELTIEVDPHPTEPDLRRWLLAYCLGPIDQRRLRALCPWLRWRFTGNEDQIARYLEHKIVFTEGHPRLNWKLTGQDIVDSLPTEDQRYPPLGATGFPANSRSENSAILKRYALDTTAHSEKTCKGVQTGKENSVPSMDGMKTADSCDKCRDGGSHGRQKSNEMAGTNPHLQTAVGAKQRCGEEQNALTSEKVQPAKTENETKLARLREDIRACQAKHKPCKESLLSAMNEEIEGLHSAKAPANGRKTVYNKWLAELKLLTAANDCRRKMYRDAEKLLAETGRNFANALGPRQRARLLLMQSTIELKLARERSGKRLSIKAARIGLNVGDFSIFRKAIGNLTIAYAKLGSTDMASEWLMTAIVREDMSPTTVELLNLSALELRKRNFQLAADYAKAVLRNATELSTSLVGKAAFNAGAALFALSRYDEAAGYFAKSIGSLDETSEFSTDALAGLILGCELGETDCLTAEARNAWNCATPTARENVSKALDPYYKNLSSAKIESIRIEVTNSCRSDIRESSKARSGTFSPLSLREIRISPCSPDILGEAAVVCRQVLWRESNSQGGIADRRLLVGDMAAFAGHGLMAARLYCLVAMRLTVEGLTDLAQLALTRREAALSRIFISDQRLESRPRIAEFVMSREARLLQENGVQTRAYFRKVYGVLTETALDSAAPTAEVAAFADRCSEIFDAGDRVLWDACNASFSYIVRNGETGRSILVRGRPEQAWRVLDNGSQGLGLQRPSIAASFVTWSEGIGHLIEVQSRDRRILIGLIRDLESAFTEDTLRRSVGAVRVMSEALAGPHLSLGRGRKKPTVSLGQFCEGIRPHPSAGMICQSEAFQISMNRIQQLASAGVGVLLVGETGTGKELLARRYHDWSKRKNGPLVAIDCPGIPDSLAESELFGHTPGAFTGAIKAHEGLIAKANGGTLFLDEVGDMSEGLQAKLLRVLENREIRSLGENTKRKLDFGLVSASNIDLVSATENGRFRLDLLHRLGVAVRVPSLRERLEDVIPLWEAYLSALPGGACGYTEEVRELLLSYTWPGNVRELVSVATASKALSSEAPIEASLVSGLLAGSRVPLHHGGRATGSKLGDSGSGDDRQSRIFQWMTERGSVSRRDYSRHFSVSARTALRDLQALVCRGVLVRKGKGRGTCYKLLFDTEKTS